MKHKCKEAYCPLSFLSIILFSIHQGKNVSLLQTSLVSKVKWCIYIAPFHKRLKGALQWSIYPQRTGSIYRRKWQPLLSSPCMLVLILPTSEGWKAEWTLAGKKVAKYSTLGRTGIRTRDLRVGRQGSYHCATPPLMGRWQEMLGRSLSWCTANRTKYTWKGQERMTHQHWSWNSNKQTQGSNWNGVQGT